MTAMGASDAPRPVGEHVRELRRRFAIAASAVLVASLTLLPLSPRIFELLARPLLFELPVGASFVVLTPFEAWYACFQIALIGGLLLAAPVWCGQLFAFFSPALSAAARRLALLGGSFAGLLFCAGGLVCFFWVLPAGFRWAVELTRAMGVQMLPRLDAYLSLVFGLVVAFGLAFQLPFGVAMLMRIGLLSAKDLSHARPAVILGAFVAGAVLTPPDIFSQVMMAVMLILLFEAGVLLGRLALLRGRSDGQSVKVPPS